MYNVYRYNSYNRDHGYDLYEGEFIDDSEEAVNQTPKKYRRKEKRSRCDSNSSSSSDIGGRRSKRKKVEVQLSSDEDVSQSTSNHGNKPAGTTTVVRSSVNDNHTRHSSDSDIDCSLRAAVNRSRLDSYLSDSSEEDTKIETKTRKKRRVQCPESDEELAR